MSSEFEPTIVAFLCNWCTFTAADLAGTSRLSYPQNVKIIRMMCSGMVDPVYVLKAFLEGADGVFIGGCWPGDCHYINGNLKARRRVALLTEILKQFGIEEDRFWLRWVAASDGVMFQALSKEMTEKLQGLGPNDLAVVVNNPIMEPLDFFNYVARSFGLPGEYASKGAFLEAFGDFLLTSHYKGKRILLIIDECQLLDSTLLNEVRLFLNFEKKGSLLINVFFVGQLEFKQMLLQPENRAIRQRIAVSYSIPPLSLKETEKYIEYRLAVAGNDKKIFKTGAIREIYHFSKGYPRLINIIADRALLTGYIDSARQIKKGIIKECAEELDFSAINKNQ